MNDNKNDNLNIKNIQNNSKNLENNTKQEDNTEIELQKKLSKIKYQISENLLRYHAKIENIKKQSEIQIKKIEKENMLAFSKKLVEIIDNLEEIVKKLNCCNNTEKSIVEGISLTVQSLLQTTKKNGLKKQKKSEKYLNFKTHHITSDKKLNNIIDDNCTEIITPGYTLNGEVIRKATIKSSINKK